MISTRRKLSSIVLFGQGPLAVSVLERLEQEGLRPCLVNDSEGANGLLATTAADLSIDVTAIHPRKSVERLTSKIDKHVEGESTLLSVNFRYVLGIEVLRRFRWPLNIHGSLLPRYRGRTPHVWAIINGERQTGITLHIMDEGVDTGPIVMQETVPIQDNMTGADLLQEFERRYPALVIGGIRCLEEGLEPRSQASGDASYFGKRTPDMGLIDFRLPFRHLRNFVRAQAPPYPGAYCYLSNGERIIVSKVDIAHSNNDDKLPMYSPRRVGSRIVVRTDEGIIECTPHHAKGVAANA